MTEDEFIALAAVAGWVVDICPTADEFSGIVVTKGGGKWYAETGQSVQEVVDKLRVLIFP